MLDPREPSGYQQKIVVAKAAAAAGLSSEKITALLLELEVLGDLRLKPMKLRHVFKRLRPAQEMDAAAEILTLQQHFAQRSQHELDRVEAVVKLTRHRGCVVQFLLRTFGEKVAPCGNCRSCQPGSAPSPRSFYRNVSAACVRR